MSENPDSEGVSTVCPATGCTGIEGAVVVTPAACAANEHARRDANTVEPSTSVSQELNVNDIVAIKNGPDGELYFVALMTDGEISGRNRGEGAIFKLAAAA